MLSVSRLRAPLVSAAASAAVLALSCGSANAAPAPNGVAWLWAEQPDAAGAYTPNTLYSYNSSGKGVTVTPIATGQYKVSLPGLKSTGATNAMVTAYGTSGYCVVQNWEAATATVSVRVRCYDKDGKAANARFTLLYQTPTDSFGDAGTGLAFVLADQLKTESYTPEAAVSYNSTGGTNTILREKRGRYMVNLPGLTTIGGTVIVSAYGPNPARCKISNWGQDADGTHAEVYCFDDKGVAGDAQFTLLYSRKSPVAHADRVRGVYAYGSKPTEQDYTAPKTYAYNGLTDQALTIHHAGLGQYSVAIPGLSGIGPSSMLVSAVGPDNVYCNVVGWTPLVTQCYAQGANQTESRFTTAFHEIDPK
jgi:hypothetical protein